MEGAALALLAAVISVLVIQGQINQARTHREDEIARRHNAARLTLPLALAAVSELTQRIAEDVADEYAERKLDEEEDREKTGFQPVFLPNEVLSSFADFVASLNHRGDLRHVAELVASIQILISRFNDFDLKQAGARLSLASLLLDAGKVRLLTDKIYNYARFVDDTSFGIVGVISHKAAWSEIQGKVHGLLFHRNAPDAFLRDLRGLVDGYKMHDVSPWNEKFGD